MKEVFRIEAVIYWVGLKSTIPTEVTTKEDLESYLLSKGIANPEIDFFGTYAGFVSYLNQISKDELSLNTVVIKDKAYHCTNISGDKINFVDVIFESSNLQVFPKVTNETDFTLAFKTPHKKEEFLVRPQKQFKDYYKEILATYKKVTFFDHFNTFKYVLNKDLRKELEECVYRYFIGVDSLDTFRDSFRKIETQLKPAQLEKYQTVKDFAFSERTGVLKSLVEETNQEKVKVVLDKYSLDYFDVNYLKAYLRDYGKTKEEKGKKKERVQTLKFEETTSSDDYGVVRTCCEDDEFSTQY